MIKATILTAGAAAAIFGALMATPAQAAPMTSHASSNRGGPCENSSGDGGLLGLGLLNFQQNDCDIYYGGGGDYYGGRHHHWGHWGDWD
ncbi:hypothetical protein [Actinomadura harenae]|uniref:Uncharacterized protein n=1 Tax=Actinomadura harenae TaxID=2483351 RepID=A0A3M2LXC6_9ACTN|nr:hypothetical protein [Actinomadura harenae]RMI41560.1 hypothetical protein EBO15_22415 [Actinomadura harenae]